MIPEGTLVDLPRGFREVEKLEIGDLVLTEEGQEEIYDVRNHKEQSNNLITFSDGEVQEYPRGYLLVGDEVKIQTRPIDLVIGKDQFEIEEYNYGVTRYGGDVRRYTTSTVVGYLDNYLLPDMIDLERVSFLCTTKHAYYLRRLLLFIGCHPTMDVDGDICRLDLGGQSKYNYNFLSLHFFGNNPLGYSAVNEKVQVTKVENSTTKNIFEVITTSGKPVSTSGFLRS